MFGRRQSSTSSGAKDGLATRKREGQNEPEWASIRDITQETLKVWLFSPSGSPIPVPESDYGYFYSNEMYVVLKAANHNTKICYDIHFWIGAERAKRMEASPPQKVAQLMAVLDDKVVLHREIQGFESPQFKRYFKIFGVHSGSVEEAFDPKRPSAFRPKLLHFKLNKDKSRTFMYEVPISRNSLDQGDVFIYDEGVRMTQWNGSRCDEEERTAARRYIEGALKKRQCKCTSEFYDEEDLFDGSELYKKLGNATFPPKPKALSKKNFTKSLLRLSDESRRLVLTKVYSGKIYRDGINSNDVTFIETHNVLYIYIGPGASENERNSCWEQGTKYLRDVSRPNKSMAVFNAGSYLQDFNEVWDDAKRV